MAFRIISLISGILFWNECFRYICNVYQHVWAQADPDDFAGRLFYPAGCAHETPCTKCRIKMDRLLFPVSSVGSADLGSIEYHQPDLLLK